MALPAILQCFIEEATKGSIPHAKALMTMAGLDKEESWPMTARVRQRAGRRSSNGVEAQTLSELLMLELRRGSEKKVSAPTEACT